MDEHNLCEEETGSSDGSGWFTNSQTEISRLCIRHANAEKIGKEASVLIEDAERGVPCISTACVRRTV